MASIKDLFGWDCCCTMYRAPDEKEIIIDVPLALKIMLSGYLWPVASWQEFVAGDFVAEPEDITVSPR